MSEQSEVLTQAEIGTILRLALAEVERLRSDIEVQRRSLKNTTDQIMRLADENILHLQERDEEREQRNNLERHISNDVAGAYQSELDSIAEQLGVEGIAEIRDAITALQERDRKSDYVIREINTYREQAHERAKVAEDRAKVVEDRAKVAEATSAALYQTAWLMLGAPVTSEHRQRSSTTYWARRCALAEIVEGMQKSNDYPGRQLLLQLEQANERAETAIERQLRDAVRILFVEFPWIALSDAGTKLYTALTGTPPPTMKKQQTIEEPIA